MTPEEAVVYEGQDRVVHFTDYLKLRSNKNPQIKQFKSHFESFDNAMGGIETGEVVVVTGHRKEGKTLFVESWIRSMAVKDPSAKCMLLSFEVQPEKLISKYKDCEWMPIYLPLSLEAMNFDWLKRKCVEAKFKYNAKIIMIDHLHYLVDMSEKQNMSLNIGGFMRGLKLYIANELNLAVILIAHQGQPKEGKEASIDTIRDSSFVAQESDATVVVCRRENFNQTELKEIYSKNPDNAERIVSQISPPLMSNPEDKYSSQLAIVKIECHRRMGTYRWKKLFQKRGEFMEEV